MSTATVSIPDLLTRPECAALLRISLDGLDKVVHAEENPIPMLRVGRRFLFDREDVLSWARKNADRSRRGGRR